MDKNKTHLQVGMITRPHGLRGELKVRLHNEESTSLAEASHVVVEDTKGGATSHEIESVRGNSKGTILALRTVESREGAEALRGALVWVERKAVEPLAPGEYYLIDVVGCDVLFSGDSIGKVSQVRPDPSTDTLIVKLATGAEAEIPLVDAWIGKVDIEGRQVELLSLDGLIES